MHLFGSDRTRMAWLREHPPITPFELGVHIWSWRWHCNVIIALIGCYVTSYEAITGSSSLMAAGGATNWFLHQLSGFKILTWGGGGREVGYKSTSGQYVRDLAGTPLSSQQHPGAVPVRSPTAGPKYNRKLCHRRHNRDPRRGVLAANCPFPIARLIAAS